MGGSTDEFRIDVEHYGPKSVLFTRWEPKDKEIVTEFRGFGHEYEKAATKEVKGCEGATGHHRIISIVRRLSCIPILHILILTSQ